MRILARCLALASLPAFSLQAQTRPAFEVASIKQSLAAPSYNQPTCANGRLYIQSYPLSYAIAWAYDLNTPQFTELLQRPPKSGSLTTLFDIEAKAEHPDSVTLAQCREMLQALLADRFQLAVHWESQEFEVSNLVLARGGSKLKPALDSDDGSDVKITLNGRVFPTKWSNPGAPKGITMAELADLLTRGLSRQPVNDKTGLEGRYKIDLHFTLEGMRVDDPSVADPSLDAALPEQLGLGMEHANSPQKVLLVDRFEPPTPN